MGTSTSTAQLVGKIAQAGQAIKQSGPKSVKAAAMSMKGDLEHSRNAAVGSDGRMSHVGKSGAKLGVGFKMSGDEATFTGTGPWPLIENKIPAHMIRPRKGKKRGVAFRGVVRASAHHPGTKGKKPWRKGVDAGTPKAAKILRAGPSDAVKAVFG